MECLLTNNIIYVLNVLL